MNIIMMNIMKNKILSALLIIMTVTFTFPTLANDKVDINCYEKSIWDLDNDGYAAEGAIAEVKSVDEDKSEKCPAGFVKSGGDCNDNNTNVHPYRLELSFNNRDDNCNGKTDETEYFYDSAGYSIQNNSFGIKTKVNSQNIVTAYNQGNLYAKIIYQKLRDSYDRETGYTKIGSLPYTIMDGGITRSAYVTLSGLSRANVYRARVHFYKDANKALQGTKGYVANYQMVQEAGDVWYYSTSNDTDYKTSKARTKILTRSFHQYFEQQRGRVGQEGSVDPNGTRYGADYYEAWCTEFYSWNAKVALYFIGSVSSTTSMAIYFWNHYYKQETDILNKWARADWLALDTNDDGKKNHTGMVLAWDSRENRFWTIEGNTGNRVGIKKREMEIISGLGHITSSKVK
ncbi:MAG: putative metal-binding motif-containing protein [Bdellovibrio sp.]|nr:putative metal-binding motif-containing protein [Bdellovibrio sp.]